MPAFVWTDFAQELQRWITANPMVAVAVVGAWALAGWVWLVQHLDARADRAAIQREIDAIKREVDAEKARDAYDRQRMQTVVRLSDRRRA